MRTTYKHHNVTWIDLESPTGDEVRKLIDTYELPAHVAEELLLPTLKPKVEFYNHSLIYLILHFPAFKHTHHTEQNQEVDFLIGRDFIITTRYDTVDPLHKFSKIFERDSILDKSDIGEHAGFLFYYMIKKLYRALEHELEYIASSLDEIEARVFEGREKEMVVELSKVSRDLLNLKQALAHHREILESLDAVARRMFGESFTQQLRSISNEYYRVHHDILTNTDSLTELRETNNSLLSTKQNEVMKVLTIMAFVTFPLSLIASIFGMNTKTLPIVGQPYDFWIIIGIMAAAVILFFAYFKSKDWL